jgi:L-threonylcarbamoyladenylate synthase
MISALELERFIGPVIGAEAATGDVARMSPGQLDRHYSPRARLILAEASDVERVMREFENSTALTVSVDVGERMPTDAAAYASVLYERLHAVDARGVAVVVVERVPDGVAWDGVRDRLRRAAR